MSDFLRAALGLFAAMAPIGGMPAWLALSRREATGTRALAAGRAAAVALGLLVLAAVISTPFLDWLNVSPENFQFAAGLVMMPLAMRLLLFGRSMSSADTGPPGRLGWLVPLAVPLLASPAAVVAAMAYGARFGEGQTIGAAAIALAVTWPLMMAAPQLETILTSSGISVLGRMSGALIVIVAVELFVNAVRSV